MPNENNTTALSGNKGEWSEIYIFLKLLDDGKVYAADKDMNLIPTVYLNILKILREEIPGNLYEYKTGEIIKIDLNGQECGPDVTHNEIRNIKDRLWNLFETTPRGNITSAETEAFLNSIHIFKLKAPPSETTNFFGGTEDIIQITGPLSFQMLVFPANPSLLIKLRFLMQVKTIQTSDMNY